MNHPLIQVLEQVPHIEIVDIQQDLMKFEVLFRVDSTWWTHKLEFLTRGFPEVYFTKRYITDGDRFGFRWSILKFGQMEEDQWVELAERFGYLLLEADLPTKPKKEVKPAKKASAPQPKVKVLKRPIYNDNNEAVGEEMNFPIPHIYNELNVPTKKKGGAFKRHQEASRVIEELESVYGALKGSTG